MVSPDLLTFVFAVFKASTPLSNAVLAANDDAAIV